MLHIDEVFFSSIVTFCHRNLGRKNNEISPFLITSLCYESAKKLTKKGKGDRRRSTLFWLSINVDRSTIIDNDNKLRSMSMLRVCQETKLKREKAIDDDRHRLDERPISIDRRWSTRSRAAINVDHVDQGWKNVYINLELDTLLKSCSIHLNYLVIVFIAKAYVISYCFFVRLFLNKPLH